MAEAFPQSRFWGFDYHEKSIETARGHARNMEIENRVSFEVASAMNYPAEGFDLICFFDCLHDMGDPVGAARHAKRALADDGTVMLVEPFANDRVEENLNAVGRLYYSASATLCCAHSLSEDGAAALGAQAGGGALGQRVHKSRVWCVQKSQGDAVQFNSRSEGLESSCRNLRKLRDPVKNIALGIDMNVFMCRNKARFAGSYFFNTKRSRPELPQKGACVWMRESPGLAC